MKTEACPDRETLQLLLLGKMRGQQLDELSDHFQDCALCAELAGTLPTSDDFLDAFKHGTPIGGEEDIIAQAIERAVRIKSDAETLESEETRLENHALDNADSSQSSETVESGSIDFLDEPDQAGDIGRLGEYRILEVLGVGGMGIVFLAEDPKLKRQIALKAMKPAIAASQSARERFVREAQATAAIEHDNIVSIYQVGEHCEIPFIAMPYLRGESLKARLDRVGKLDESEVLRIGREVADGLAAAHERGLIHRDIKPDNIWLEGKRGRVKIVDFGLARTIDDDTGLTQTGVVVGTPKYMAPEQAQGQSVDHRCDLFSLGSMLYHLTTGKPAFDEANLMATLMAVASQHPEATTTLNPNVSPEFAELIEDLLRKEPSERPQSADEVSDRIAAIEPRIEERHEEVAVPDSTYSEIVIDEQPAVAGIGNRNRSLVTTLVGTVAFFAVISIAVFTIVTKKGTVVITTNGKLSDAVEVKISSDKEQVAILDKNNNWTIKLIGGEYSVELAGSDDEFNLKDGTLTVSRFGKSVVEIEYRSKALVAAKNGGQTEHISSVVTGEEPQENYALEFDGEDGFVEIPSLNNDSYEPVTIEISARPETLRPQILFYGWGTRSLTVSFSQRWYSGRTFSDGSWGPVWGNDRVTEAKQAHLAAVWDGVRIKLFVNGKLQGPGVDQGETDNRPGPTIDGISLAAGMKADKTRWSDTLENFHGLIDEVRFSNVARYTEDFTPAKRFEKDEHTMALYHFDEGRGEVLRDSSGNGHHGKIVGAKWVRVDDELRVLATGNTASVAYNWPKHQPAPSIAPFTAEEAQQHQEEWAEHLGVPVEKEIDLGGGEKMIFMLIPPGEFVMGASKEERVRFLEFAMAADDKWARLRMPTQGPPHLVRITVPFYFGKHEVTKAQWHQVMKADSSSIIDPALPACNISWFDAESFANKLNRDEDLVFRLPTEAQWEYACRAGTVSAYYFDESMDELGQYGWFRGNSENRAHEVGQLKPNSWGLHDLYGNVSEWCADFFDGNYYSHSPLNDPTGPAEGTLRVIRGFDFDRLPLHCRSAHRDCIGPKVLGPRVGVRLTLSLDGIQEHLVPK